MKKIFFILILLLAFVLRFYQLNTYPALNADEAALGYNAYSLLKTGMDEHGNPWPIHFQSFNDYKPGLYVYLILPFIYLFGLNEWSVRIPGAFLGVLTVVSLYFLVRELFSKRKEKEKWTIDLFSALFLAISPWHIHFSRGGWEVNVATFFIVTGLLFFFKGLKKSSYFSISIIFFVLSLYTYHAARILAPTLGLVLLGLYWSDIWKKKVHVIGSFVLGFLLVIPLILELFGPAGISRAAGVGLLADPGPLNRINELRGQHTDFQNDSATLFHNKGVNYGLAFLENWAKHFEGEFLFLSGDIIQRNRVPETGQTHMLFIFLFAAGIYKIARYVSWKEVFYIKVPHPESETKALTFLLLWLIISPLAASLTFQSPHALRAQNMVIPLEMINALGLSVLVSWAHSSLKSKYLVPLFYILIVFGLSWSFLRYQHMYWIHMAKEYPYSSQYGVKELVSYIQSREGEFEKVLITDRYDQPYIMVLFYTKYDPSQFQKEHTLSPRDQYGFSTVHQFGKYNFWTIDFESVKRDYRNSLIAGTDGEIPKEANIVKEIYGTNGFKYFEVVAN